MWAGSTLGQTDRVQAKKTAGPEGHAQKPPTERWPAASNDTRVTHRGRKAVTSCKPVGVTPRTPRARDKNLGHLDRCRESPGQDSASLCVGSKRHRGKVREITRDKPTAHITLDGEKQGAFPLRSRPRQGAPCCHVCATALGLLGGAVG